MQILAMELVIKAMSLGICWQQEISGEALEMEVFLIVD